MNTEVYDAALTLGALIQESLGVLVKSSESRKTEVYSQHDVGMLATVAAELTRSVPVPPGLSAAIREWELSFTVDTSESETKTVSLAEAMTVCRERRQRFEDSLRFEVDEEMLDEDVEFVDTRPAWPSWLTKEGT